MAAFELALRSVQDDVSHCLAAAKINQLARDEKIVFRDTPLTPQRTLELFVKQVANGNVACAAMGHLAGQTFSDSAWVQARQRLPIELIQKAFRNIVDDAREKLKITGRVGDEPYLWHGHRVHVIDGTSDSMSDTPELRAHYGVPSGVREGLGFPTSHLVLLMDHQTGLFIDCIDTPMITSDLSQTEKMHAHLQPGDVLLGDIAFSSYAHLALLLQGGFHAVLPVHHKRIIDFTKDRPAGNPRKGKSSKAIGKPRSAIVRSLGTDDHVVKYVKPVEKPQWMSEEGWKAIPEAIEVREIRRTISRAGFRPITVTIVTTLLDGEKYPADKLIELRMTRWRIELNIRHLKTTLGMDVLKCKTLDGIRKERMIFLLVYNLIRIAMINIARLHNVDINRLSFANTLAWMQLGDMRQPTRIKVNPLREGRLEPRVIKRQKKEFPYMTKPRAILKAELLEKYGLAA
jgi:hypothetical protein